MKKKTRKKGIAYLVGAGPGDPGLITVKAVACLKKADVVVYDYLASESFLALAPAASEKIYVGKRAGHHSMKQVEINKLLVRLVLSGKTVVRLKGGDPFVFGRGGEECAALHDAKLPFEVVPGISSGIAGPAYAGIPVTNRGDASSVALITGHEDPAKETSSLHWKNLACGVDTLVFYMGVGNLKSIADNLIANGRPATTPVAIIERATTPSQRTVVGKLGTIAETAAKAKVSAPALTVVGNVVKRRSQFSWFENKPLFGKRIVVTRTREQASALSEMLGELGAAVLEMPTIAISPLIRHSNLRALKIKPSSYDWIIFTSPNGVQIFLDAVTAGPGDIRDLGSAMIACIGPGTARVVEQFHLKPAVVAHDAVAEGLLRELVRHGTWKGKMVLLPRAEKARDIIPQTLAELGATVDVLPVYRTTAPEQTDTAILNQIEEGRYDLVTFTSSSTVENFFSFMKGASGKKIKKSLQAASIGPVTTATLRQAGVKPVVEAQEHTIPGLVAAIRKHFKK